MTVTLTEQADDQYDRTRLIIIQAIKRVRQAMRALKPTNTPERKAAHDKLYAVYIALIEQLQILDNHAIREIDNDPGMQEIIAKLSSATKVAKKEAGRLGEIQEDIDAFTKMLGTVTNIVSNLMKLATPL